MKKIKVLFVLSNLYPGGAQRTIVNIVNALNKEKYDINLVLLNKTKNEFYKNSIDADINYEYLSKKSRYSFIKLRKKILNFKPSIIFSTLNYVNIITFLTIKSTRVKSKIILRQSAIVRKKII